MPVSVGLSKKKLTITKVLSMEEARPRRVVCNCSCGKEVNILANNFMAGKHCSCEKHLHSSLLGNEYQEGKIKITELVARAKDREGKRGHLYKCLCTWCNNEYLYPSVAIRRKGFIGCRCKKDNTIVPKGLIFRSYKSNAQSRGLSFNLSFDDFVSLAEGTCVYCGTEKSNYIKRKAMIGEWYYNGIDRIDNSRGYELDNVETACRTCNFMKCTMGKEEFLEHIQKIYKHSL